MNNSTQVPHWNLDKIFPSLESDEYKDALKKCNSLFENLEQLLETASKFIRESNSNFDFSLWLKSFIDIKAEHSKILKTLSAYAYVIYSTDTTNTAFLNNLDAIEKLGIRENEINVQFTTIVVSHQIHLEEFYSRFPEYEQFRFLLEEILEKAKASLAK